MNNPEKAQLETNTETAVPRLSTQHITKIFPGVVALQNVDFVVNPGEIHAIVGENGAGKSTLMHIVAGVHQPDEGTMEIDGVPHQPEDEKAAQNAGVAMVFQEGSLFTPLKVSENIFAGRQPLTPYRTIDFKTMDQETRKLLNDLDLEIKPSTLVENLSPGQKQLVDIAKALSQNVRLLILDEPTSSLTITEARQLFLILNRLKERNVAIVYVTHRLSEVFEIADRVTVLRDGEVTGVRNINDTNHDELINLEVGRELSFENQHRIEAEEKPVVLEVKNLASNPVVDASLKVHAGEIVCLAGLVGAGRTELGEAIFGLRPIERGSILLDGEEIQPKHPYDAMKAGIGMVPEDRREAGLFLEMSIAANITATNLREVSNGELIQNRKITKLANQATEMLNIITPSIDREVMYLSGGNQQKVLLAKWLARQPEMLIVDEPTRGVDVGAKSDLYTILRELADSDVALLVISSDLPEVLALAHRIVVMADGRTVGELDAADANETAILQLATPVGVTKLGGQI